MILESFHDLNGRVGIDFLPESKDAIEKIGVFIKEKMK